MVKKILVVIIVLVCSLILGGYFWLRSSRPAYEGTISIAGLSNPVNVHFDDFGVPHIEAENNHDLFMAFGYVHAQERLFQMEMMRRAGSGTLAEIIGQPMIKVDRIFLTLGMKESAEQSAALFENKKGTPMYEAIKSYLDGVNYFIEHGPTPPEFSIIGITKRKFEPIDLYYITGAMAFNFGMAQKTEPVVDYIAKHFGEEHLYDIGLFHSKETSIPTTPHDSAYLNSVLGLAKAFEETEAIMPFATLNGSNAWAVSGAKTASGEVIVSNDTHIGYMIPQTWYEAHLKSPEFEMSGHYLAGVPFALIGRDRYKAWGVTMLLNDDMDFYTEQPSSGDSISFLYEGNYEPCKQKSYAIRVKGLPDTTIHVRVTRNGPIINDIFKLLPSQPVSVKWTYTQLENRNLEAFWQMNNARDIQSFEQGLSLVHAPGLSINYGDAEGHIAWWAAARFTERGQQVNSWTILDGSKVEHAWKSYYPFEMNPRCIDPASGYIYSANDWPDDLLKYASDTNHTPLFYPGYYKPQYRADRIRTLLEPENKWTLEKMKGLINDCRSETDEQLLEEWTAILSNSTLQYDQRFVKLKESLDWNGEYNPELVAPTLFNRLLYHSMRLAMEDEVGHELFKLYLTTHQFQRSIRALNDHPNSPWWDNVHTTTQESRNDILQAAFEAAYEELERTFGSDVQQWTWGKSASVELKHPLGEVAMLRPFFSIGQRSVWGGNETIHQAGFYLDSTSYAKVFFGSQMRTMVDFSDVDNGLNITPSGQSGHLLSKHYDDQASLYAQRDFRPQTLRIEPSWRTLKLVPQ
ncbi:MAG: penicillin acylase family protein [Flavobacteriales bacterium]